MSWRALEHTWEGACGLHVVFPGGSSRRGHSCIWHIWAVAGQRTMHGAGFCGACGLLGLYLLVAMALWVLGEARCKVCLALTALLRAVCPAR